MSLAEDIRDTAIQVRRVRRPELVTQTAPEEESLSRNAARVAEGIERLQDSERKALQENSDLKARLEQQVIRNNELTNEAQMLRLDREALQNEVTRLGVCVEGIIHAAQRAIEQPGHNEQD